VILHSRKELTAQAKGSCAGGRALDKRPFRIGPGLPATEKDVEQLPGGHCSG
jgi:hypothetical protein